MLVVFPTMKSHVIWSLDSRISLSLWFLFAIFLGILWLWQRALVVELFTISCEALEVNEFCWLNELYPGEFDDLRKCNLFSEDTCGPVPPRLMEGKSDMPPLKFNSQPNHENLQVYGWFIFIKCSNMYIEMLYLHYQITRTKYIETPKGTPHIISFLTVSHATDIALLYISLIC